MSAREINAKKLEIKYNSKSKTIFPDRKDKITQNRT